MIRFDFDERYTGEPADQGMPWFARVLIADLAFNALFGRVEPGWIAKLIATGFLVIAIVIFIGAERRSCSVMARLHAHTVQSAKIDNIRILAFASVAAAAALIAAIWLLTFEPPKPS